MTLFDKLRESGAFIHVACAGAGSTLITKLWEEPGASEWLSGGTFVYAPVEMEEFLGFPPEEGAVSSTTAIYMAMGAYQRACKAKPAGNSIGVGLTAAVATNRIRRGGGEEFYVAALSKDICALYAYKSDEKTMGKEQRLFQEDHCSEAALEMLNWCFVKDYWKWTIEPDMLLKTAINYVNSRCGDGQILYPGAFNPIHEGHRRLVSTVEALTGDKVCYHINTNNPHKPALTATDLLRRCSGSESFLVDHNLPLYIDKARAYPGTAMIIGTDALQRMLDPKWGPDVVDMLEEFHKLGTFFYVGERIVNGEVLTLQKILRDSLGESEDEMRWLFQSVGITGPESSTEIRNGIS